MNLNKLSFVNNGVIGDNNGSKSPSNVAPSRMISFKSSNNDTFSKNSEALNTVTPELHKLFKSIPKTELHLHLSGSTPKVTMKEILKEEGKSDEYVEKETNFKTEFKHLDDFLESYYKVAWCVKTPEHFKKSAYQICMDAADENVKYLEIRTSCVGKEGNPDEILQAVTDGITQANKELAKKGYQQEAKIIVLAQRHHSPIESFQHALIAAEWARKPGSLVVGFDVAGSEFNYPITLHKTAIEFAKSAGLKITIHAGETPKSIYEAFEKEIPIFGTNKIKLTAADSIKNALDYGADRIGHAIHLYDNSDLVKRVRAENIAIESAPRCNVQLNNVTSYQDHPIKKMLDDNLLVSVVTDNRTISDTTLTREFEELYKHNVITKWDDRKKLVLNGAKSVFLPEKEKKKLVNDFEQELKTIEKNPEFNKVINQYLSTGLAVVAFLGHKIKNTFNNKAA
jgi:adenosine deaminase